VATPVGAGAGPWASGAVTRSATAPTTRKIRMRMRRIVRQWMACSAARPDSATRFGAAGLSRS